VLQIDFAGIITPIILIQMIVSVVAYIWVRGTVQALKRADRAEEIARLEYDLAHQAEEAASQKQRLEASIQKIVEVHTRVANGDFGARVPLTQDNVLWQISGALNNLLSRVQRLQHDAAELQRLKFALQQAREENRLLTRKLGDTLH
jgi:methyl-accepting chemotaxis protein